MNPAATKKLLVNPYFPAPEFGGYQAAMTRTRTYLSHTSGSRGGLICKTSMDLGQTTRRMARERTGAYWEA